MEVKTKPPDQPRIERISTMTLIIGLFLFMLSIGTAFFGGFYLQKLQQPNEKPIRSPTPTPTMVPNSAGIPIANSNFIKDKQYFDDTIIAATVEAPHRVVIATATRQETQNGTNQATRISFFDGEKWTRKSITKNYQTSSIYTNDIIWDWNITLDPSRVLKQRVQGTLKIEDNTIEFDTNTIANNIGVRSLPGYTKFMSTGNGSLIINGTSFAANILYTRIYSNNSQEIQFYDAPFGLTTHWLAFWDNQGNFYHIDSTHVDKPTTKYETHELGIMVDSDGRVTKTFEVQVQPDVATPPQVYQVKFGKPINKILNFTTHSSLNKAPSNSYSWYMSNGTGDVENIEGFGLVEYIHN